MTVYELYDLRQKEYQEYLVSKGVYESKLKDANQQFNTELEELKNLIPSINDTIILEDVKAVISIVSGISSTSEQQNTSSITDALDNLVKLEKTMEIYVRGILNNG